MSSSNKSAEGSSSPPIIAEGGVSYSPSTSRDPFEALDDLMCVVEALTPTWPPREPMKEGKYWLL
jgi:hypothetical protein